MRWFSVGQAQIKAAQTALQHLRTNHTITVSKLQFLAECSQESARKALKKLEAKGILASHVGDGTGSPVVYYKKDQA